MAKYAIEASGLSKRYTIGMQKARYRTLRETILEKLSPSRRRAGADAGIIWALDDLNFKVEEGQSLGIIGRNGAGKSTLLKILSRITKPTRGRVVLNGRVGSLLEVGTGFHPELTGRENIYLNGAILGMRRAEIERKFDEIVDFAEIEKFLETPVKRYSSGMYVRLAFAVAAHLEPEILLVDEVLAVGDHDFQKKCLGKMDDVTKSGRTVLFVSHNMAAVQNLCPQSMLIEKGKIHEIGATEDVVHSYLTHMKQFKPLPLSERTDRKGSGKMRFTQFEVAEGSQSPGTAVLGADTRIDLHYEGQGSLRNVKVGLAIYNLMGERIVGMTNDSADRVFETIPDKGVISVRIDRFPLVAGTYRVNLFCEVGNALADWVQDAAVIEVHPGDYYGSGKIPGKKAAKILIPNTWDVSILN